MAKPRAAGSDEQGMTKKQLKRLERKRKKLLAEAGVLPGPPSGHITAALDIKDVPDGKDPSREDGGVNARGAGAESAVIDAEELAAGGGTNREEDADKALAGVDENDIRNSLVGKVAEALLAKQLEEERAATPARKRARHESKASPAVVPSVGVPAMSKKEKNKEKNKEERAAGKKGKKERKEKKKEKKRKKKERENQEPPANAGLDEDKGVAPGSGSRKRQRGVKASQQKTKSLVNDAEGRETRASKKRKDDEREEKASKNRKGEEKEAKQGKKKQPKQEQSSPWPEIKCEASSAHVVLRQGQSVMFDGVADVTLISGGASVMGYRLRRDEDVLVTSCGQLAPVSIIVHDRAGGRNDLGVKEHETRVLRRGEDGETSRGEEAVVLFRSCWLKRSDGLPSSGGQRTFRLVR